jgi:hypothetical protein
VALEKAIRSLLVDDGSVAALVGNRVYPVQRKQGSALPAVVYQQITGVRDHTFAGASGFVASRYQITCWAETYGGADALADAVRAVMDGYAGTKESVVIQCIHLQDEGDMPALVADNESLNFHGKRLDFMVWYDE